MGFCCKVKDPLANRGNFILPPSRPSMRKTSGAGDSPRERVPIEK
jgi:hypothetical protein